MTAAQRRHQRGLVRGCCLFIVLAIVVLAAAAYLADRALAAPELGAAPQGPDHGDSQMAIAVALATQLTAELVTTPHAYVTLSEHDLTVLATAHTNVQSLSGVMVRIRDGLLYVSGQHSVGPFSVTPVAHVSLTFDTAGSKLTSQVVQLDIGELTLPGFIKDRVLGNYASPLDVDSLFGSSPALQVLRSNIECVSVQGAGVRVGVHRPTTSPDPGICTA